MSDFTPDQFGEVVPMDKSDITASEGSWKQAVSQACKHAEKAGKMPADIKRQIQDVLTPPSPWQAILRSYMTARARDDYSYARANRRYIGRGLFMPSAESEAMESLVLAIDVSGSINTELLSTFMAEMNEILQEVRYTRLTVLCVNTKVVKSMEFVDGEPVDLGEIRGGGGTRFTPAFEEVEKCGLSPDVLIYFTDLQCSDRPGDPWYPVLWAVPKNNKPRSTHWEPPYGEILPIG